MQRNHRGFIVLSLLFVLSMMGLMAAEPALAVSSDSLPAAARSSSKKVPAWSSDVLSQPLAEDGLILRDNNKFSFQLNPAGIPDEPLYFQAGISSDIDPATGKAPDGSDIYDPESLQFIDANELVFLGGTIDSINPGTTTYTNNSYQTESEGSNIDMIRGATAVASVTYNPSFTHQEGVLWYTPNANSSLSYSALGGSSYCSIFGTGPTFDTSASASDSVVRSEILRALSIYDPWFDEMEYLYDSRYGTDDETYRVDNWRLQYLGMDHYQHTHNGISLDEINQILEDLKKAGTPSTENAVYQELVADLSPQERTMWNYPGSDAGEIYTDFQVTIREPIEDVVFTSHSQAQTNKNNTSERPYYENIENQMLHPDITATNEIWCYDTSDAGAGMYDVDAFLITTEILPDYGYELEFRVVEGNSIGKIETASSGTDIDATDNSFRFIPNGKRQVLETGAMVRNYGSVVIEVTAKDVNYVEYFTLHFVPSNLRIVKYIGEKEASGETGTTVPDSWLIGPVIKTDGIGQYIDTENSGEWDVFNPTNSGSGGTASDAVELFGLQTIVLYPGETFELSAVSYINTDTSGGTSTARRPYYMTEGVPAIDFTQPEGDRVSWTRYAVSLGTYRDTDADEDEIVTDVLGFERYANIVETAGGLEALRESSGSTPTGRSWWYINEGQPDGNAITIKALKQGAVYLSYTLAAVNENTDEPEYSSATLTGGLWVFVVDPVNQPLSTIVKLDAGSTANMALEIPFDISICQAGPVSIDGKTYPSHWFRGKYGLFRDSVAIGGNVDDSKTMYKGRAIASFSDRYGDFSDELMLSGFSMPYDEAADITTLNVNETQAAPWTRPFTVSWERYQQGVQNALSDSGMMINPLHISDIGITGEFGLNSFQNIRTLKIEDTEGSLTLANIDDNGIFDISGLNVIYYEHTGIGIDAADDVTSIRLPYRVQVVDLADMQDPNALDCNLDFPISARNTLQELYIGYNDFSFLTIEGFSVLGLLEIDGRIEGLNDADGNHYLNCIDNASLNVITADDTQFNYIIAEFPERPYSEFTDLSAVAYTGLRANNCDLLRAVNVSGSVGYMELINNPALISVIGSASVQPGSYSTYTTDGLGNPNWIKVINLGGDNYISNFPSAEMTGWLGFNPRPEGSAAGDEKPFSRSSAGEGSNGIETIKLNNIRRLAADPDKAKSCRTFEVNNILGGINDFTATTSLGNGERADILFPRASALSQIHIGSADSSSRLNFRYTGTGLSGSVTLQVDSLTGYVDMQHSGRVNNVFINSDGGPSGWKSSTLDLQYSGITDLYGTAVLSDISVPDSITLYEGSSVDITVSAFPGIYSSSLSTTLAVDPGYDAAALDIRTTATKNIWRISANDGYGGTTVRVKVTGIASGSGTLTKYISVNILAGSDESASRLGIEVTPETAFLDGKGDYADFSAKLVAETYDPVTGQVTDTEDITDTAFADADTSNVPDAYKLKWTFSDNDLFTVEPLDPFYRKVRIRARMSDDIATFNASFEIAEQTAASDDGTITVGGSDRYSIELSESGVSFHGIDSSPVNVSVLLRDLERNAIENDLYKPFEWTIADSSIASISASGTDNNTVTITPKKKGNTTITVSYQNRPDGHVYTASIPVTFHEIQSVKLDKPTGEVPSSGAYATVTATITCECGLTVSPSSDMEIRSGDWEYTRKCSNTSHIFTLTTFNRNQFRIKAPSGCSGGTYSIKALVYDGIIYDAVSGRAIGTAKAMSFHVDAETAVPFTIAGEPYEGRRGDVPLPHKIESSSLESAPAAASAVSSGNAAPSASGIRKVAAAAYSTPDDSVNAKVGTLLLNNCSRLTDIYLDSGNITRESIYIEACSCSSLSSINIIGGGTTSIKAYSSALTSVRIEGNSPLVYLDVHDNNLGTGELHVGSFDYSNGMFGTSSPMTWRRNGNRLETLIAYGNGIYHNGWEESNVGSYQMGYDIPSDAIVADVNLSVTSNWWRGCSIDFNFGTLKKHVKGTGSVPVFWPNDTARLNAQYKPADVGSSDGISLELECVVRNGSAGWWIWHGSQYGQYTIYPFGK